MNLLRHFTILLVLSLLGASCVHAVESVTVDLSQPRQTIYGFGAGMKRQTSELKNMTEPARTEVLNLMFADVDSRILRTFLRPTHDPVNDNADANSLNASALNFGAYTNDLWVLQQAATIGAGKIDTFYASCNSPPAWMKDNADLVGGTLLATHYAEFAEFIWGYLRWMKTTNGIDIRAVSIFNEPSWFPTHESMNPSATQAADILAVVGPYLNGKVAAEPTVARPLLVAPDNYDPATSITYTDAILSNATAAAAVDVIGSHYYGGTAADWGTLNTKAGSRMLWQTEYAKLSGTDDGIEDGLELAGRMHNVLANGGEAYIAFQWLSQSTDVAESVGLLRIQTDTYQVPKRYYVFKQFANTTPRGSRRISTTASSASLQVTTYLWPDGETVSIQVINATTSGVSNISFNCPGLSGPITRRRTGTNVNGTVLANSPTATNGVFIDSAPANTFTTYIGTLHVDNITQETALPTGALVVNPSAGGAGTTLVNATSFKGQSLHLDYGITATSLALQLGTTQTTADFTGNWTLRFHRLVDGVPDVTPLGTATATLPAGLAAGDFVQFRFAFPIDLPAGDLAFTPETADTDLNLAITGGDRWVAGQLLRDVGTGWKGSSLPALDLIFALSGTYTAPAARPAPGTGPNIVMILADDLGWADLGTGAPNFGNGSDFHETPNIDTLASQGVSFTSCYMHPNCSPSRAALLCGQYAPRSGNGVYNVVSLNRNSGNQTLLVGPGQNEDVPASTTTIAEQLRAGGYVTAHIGKYHVGGREGGSTTLPQNQGFDFNFSGGSGASHEDSCLAFESPVGTNLWRFTDPQIGPELDIFANPYGTTYLAQRGWPSSLAATPKHVTDAQGDAFVELLRNHRAGPLTTHPLYVQLHAYAVHSTHSPRADLLAKYQAKPPGVRHTNAAYAAFIEGLDQLVGRVMTALDDPNGDGNTSDSIAQNTVLVFTSDNGGTQGNAPLRAGKRTFYEGGLRVPLIVRRPGTYAAGAVTQRMVHSVDFYRTFCQIAGVSAGNVPDSVSFTSALNQPTTTAQRGAIFYHFPGYTEDVATPCSVVIKETGGRRYKLIHNYETGGRELYDLTSDLSETRNLLGASYWDWLLHGAAAQELAADLTAWLTQSGTSWQPAYPTVRATGAVLGPPSSVVPEVTVPFVQTFRITDIAPAITPDRVTLTWRSASGYKYIVNGSSDLVIWTPLSAEITATASTTTQTITDPLRTTLTKRFYRVVLGP